MEGDLNPPEGQQVAVIVQPVLTPEEAIRQSFGAWAEDAAELDEFLEGLRRDRQQERPENAIVDATPTSSRSTFHDAKSRQLRNAGSGRPGSDF